MATTGHLLHRCAVFQGIRRETGCVQVSMRDGFSRNRPQSRNASTTAGASMAIMIHCREGYVDAEGVLTHLDNVGSLLAEALTLCRAHSPRDPRSRRRARQTPRAPGAVQSGILSRLNTASADRTSYELLCPRLRLM